MQRTAYRKPSSVVPGGPELFGTLVGALLRAPAALLDSLVAWQYRSDERAHLRRLTDHQLRDIGLTREEVESMAQKTVWSRCI